MSGSIPCLMLISKLQQTRFSDMSYMVVSHLHKGLTAKMQHRNVGWEAYPPVPGAMLPPRRDLMRLSDCILVSAYSRSASVCNHHYLL